MIVPQFWAEARIRDRVDGHQVTLRRFGWSDVGQQQAQAHADERVREALARVVAGEVLPQRDPKRAYNGADGMPIREEIVGRHGEAIVTRNSYGALCLNTPDVLFADIDFQEGPSGGITCCAMALFLPVAIAFGWWMQSIQYGLMAVAAALAFGRAVAVGWHWLLLLSLGGPERRARRRIDRFIERHPDWHLRLYRTPAGLRVLAMQRTFDPREPAVAECFDALGTDPIYVRMCWNQNCFRARISPKPWRIGIGHIRPRPGVWPVEPDRLPQRRQWIAEYERAALHFASCQFLDDIGSPTLHPAARAIQVLHDELCQATRPLPIA